MRHLWQVPVFFTGVVALVAVWVSRPLLPDPDRVFNHDLTEARRLLQDPRGDAHKAAQLARRAVELAEQTPEHRGEAELVLGTAHMRLAEQAPPDLARDHWRQAREHLEEAQRLGVTGEDRLRLAFRLGKVAFYTKEDPERVIKLLELGVEQGDDVAAGYELLTQAYLRLAPPDVKNAWLTNEKLRQVPKLDEDVLGPAKLMGAQLLVRMHRSEEARKTLEKISPKAPPEVLAEARQLLGRLYQEDNRWSEAAEVWKTMLADARIPLPQPGRVLYDLGVCQRHLNQLPQAAESWEQCMRRGQGEEAAAAALAAAELRLHEKHPETALDALGRAVARVGKPEQWSNTLVDLAHVRELFEQAAQAYQGASRFDLLVRLTDLYEHVSMPGRARKLRAEGLAAWAQLRLKQAQDMADPAGRAAEERAARALFCQAADCYVGLARKTSSAAEPDDDLWYCACCYMDGQDYTRAAEKLETFLQRDEVPARLGEGWYRLGECYRELKNDENAVTAAYGECLKFGPPFAYRARYQLALVSIQKGNLDAAESALEQNLKLLYFDRDPEAREKSLFALGNLLYLRKNYRKVVLRLEEALAPPCPTTPEATQARWQLADSYRMLASEEKQNELLGGDSISAQARLHFQNEHKRWMKLAVEEFQELSTLVKKPEGRGHLSRDKEMELPFIVARCRYNLGEYKEALKMYEGLTREYRNQPLSLEAMGHMVSCHAALGDAGHMREVLEKIRKAIPTIQGMTTDKQRQWLDWVETASRGLPADGGDGAAGGAEPSSSAAAPGGEQAPSVLAQPDRRDITPSLAGQAPAPTPTSQEGPPPPAPRQEPPPSVMVPRSGAGP
jgi:tetratricopeptide (TPR) repeat protein